MELEYENEVNDAINNVFDHCKQEHGYEYEIHDTINEMNYSYTDEHEYENLMHENKKNTMISKMCLIIARRSMNMKMK